MIAVDDRLKALCSGLAAYDEVMPFTGGHLTNAMLRTSKATALFIRSTTIVHRDLLANTNVQFVATATSGTDHIDREWCAANGITVVDAAGTNANAVAEWVMIVLSLFKAFRMDITVGVVGYGHVGSRVERMCRTLGLKTLVNDPPRQRAGLPVPHAVELDELLVRCSVVSLHVPMIRSGPDCTRDLIAERELALLPQEALVINTARGGVLNESDALQWIKPGYRYVAADTFANEPNINTEFSKACIVATPHIAGHTLNAFADASRLIGEAWCAWKQVPPDNVRKACKLVYPKPKPLEAGDYELAQPFRAECNRRFSDAWRKMRDDVSNALPQDVANNFMEIRRKHILRKETYLL